MRLLLWETLYQDRIRSCYGSTHFHYILIVLGLLGSGQQTFWQTMVTCIAYIPNIIINTSVIFYILFNNISTFILWGVPELRRRAEKSTPAPVPPQRHTFAP